MNEFDVKHSGTSKPHVLVIGQITEDESDRDWSIEHPDSCPVDHHYGYEWVDWLGLMPYHETHLVCPVQWEVDGNAIDSLCDADGRAWREYGGRPCLAGTLTAGRRLITAWWHDGYGAGEYGGQGDGDGTLDLIGLETPYASPTPALRWDRP